MEEGGKDGAQGSAFGYLEDGQYHPGVRETGEKKVLTGWSQTLVCSF